MGVEPICPPGTLDLESSVYASSTTAACSIIRILSATFCQDRECVQFMGIYLQSESPFTERTAYTDKRWFLFQFVEAATWGVQQAALMLEVHQGERDFALLEQGVWIPFLVFSEYLICRQSGWMRLHYGKDLVVHRNHLYLSLGHGRICIQRFFCCRWFEVVSDALLYLIDGLLIFSSDLEQGFQFIDFC